MTLGRYIGLQHIQKSASQVKNCGLQPLKGSFLKPNLKDPFCPVKRNKSHISVISHLIKMRFGVSKQLGQPLTCTKSHQDPQRIGQDMLLCFLFYRLHIHRRGNITFLDISFQNSVFLGTNPNFFSWVVRWMAGGPNGTGLTPQKTSNFWRKNAQTFGVFWWKKLKSNFLQTGMSQGLQSFYTFGRYYKALQPLLLALFTQTISQRNICRSVSQGKNDRTGRDCSTQIGIYLFSRFQG